MESTFERHRGLCGWNVTGAILDDADTGSGLVSRPLTERNRMDSVSNSATNTAPEFQDIVGAYRRTPAADASGQVSFADAIAAQGITVAAFCGRCPPSGAP